MRILSAAAACAALALAATGCNNTTVPVPSGSYTATLVLRESASYTGGTLAISPNIAVSAAFVDSTYLVGGLPAGVLAGTLTVQDGAGGAAQTVATLQAPSPHYAGTIVATSDSLLRLSVSGFTGSRDGLQVAIAPFSVDFSGAPVLARVVEPLPEAQLTPVSGLTVRWSNLPSFDQVEATVASNSTPPVTVTARGATDLGFLTFSKSQIASLPEGGATLSVTRSRVKTLSVTGLRGGTATLAATVSLPVSIVAPVTPHREDGAR